MRKKRLLVLVLSAVMLVGGVVSVYAGTDSGSDTVNGCAVSYYADCSDTYGAASTQIMAGSYASTNASAGVTLYVKNKTDGAISQYGSDVADDPNYASAEVEIASSSQSKYIGYEASTSHYARVEVDGDAETGTGYLEAENHS